MLEEEEASELASKKFNPNITELSRTTSIFKDTKIHLSVFKMRN